MKIVVDAGATFVIIATPERVARILADATDILAPELIVAEVFNACWKIARSGATAPPVRTVLGLFDRIRLLPNLPFAADAAELALRLDHPVYDCLYAVVARREGAQLLTADRRFADKLDNEDISVVTV